MYMQIILGFCVKIAKNSKVKLKFTIFDSYYKQVKLMLFIIRII